MPKQVIILGYSGHGRAVAEVVRENGDEVVAVLDDRAKKADGVLSDVKNYPDAECISGFGGAWKRANLETLTDKWYTAVHPSAAVSPEASVGPGTVIMAKACVNAGAHIGRQCIINTAAVVEHDNIIEDYVHISVGALLGGTVKIGARSWIGIGAVISNNISICEDVTVGAGAVVVKDITEPGTYAGIPARRISKDKTDEGNTE